MDFLDELRRANRILDPPPPEMENFAHRAFHTRSARVGAFIEDRALSRGGENTVAVDMGDEMTILVELSDGMVTGSIVAAHHPESVTLATIDESRTVAVDDFGVFVARAPATRPFRIGLASRRSAASALVTPWILL